jgi:hypothetical protein
MKIMGNPEYVGISNPTPYESKQEIKKMKLIAK